MSKSNPKRGASTAQAARHVGLSNVSFAKLLNDGVVERQDRTVGYDLTVVRLACFKHLRSLAAGRGGVDSGEMLSRERSLLAKEQREAVSLKNAISRGDFVSLTVVKSALVSTFATMREQCLTLPGAVADSLTPFSPKDRAEITDIIRDKVYELLEGLSEAKINFAPARGKCVDNPPHDAEVERAAN
jgi:phage terminase Nu1 subunit (DNA packaging protein)